MLSRGSSYFVWESSVYRRILRRKFPSATASECDKVYARRKDSKENIRGSKKKATKKERKTKRRKEKERKIVRVVTQFSRSLSKAF